MGLPLGILETILRRHLHDIKMQNNSGLTESANWDYVNEGETVIKAEFRRLILILLIMEHSYDRSFH